MSLRSIAYSSGYSAKNGTGRHSILIITSKQSNALDENENTDDGNDKADLLKLKIAAES